VSRELTLRKLSLSGNLSERRLWLRQHLTLEECVQSIQEAIQRTNEGKEAALILIKQTVPCIMHMENRVGERIITVAISIGATRFQLDQRISGLNRYVDRI
jgi:hypothetical protein